MVESRHRLFAHHRYLVVTVVRFRAMAQAIQIWSNRVSLEMRYLSSYDAIYCAAKLAKSLTSNWSPLPDLNRGHPDVC